MASVIRSPWMHRRDSISFRSSFSTSSHLTGFIQGLRNRQMIIRLDAVEERPVNALIAGQLRVKRRRQNITLANKYRLAVDPREALDVGAHPSDFRRPYEDRLERASRDCCLNVAGEAIDLAAVGVPLNRDIDQ